MLTGTGCAICKSVIALPYAVSCNAFDCLAVCYNPIVMERASSFLEIKLRKTDLVK